MKKSIAIILFSIFFTAACTTGIKTVTKGLENNSFIEIVGSPMLYPQEGVEVVLNNNSSFFAVVNPQDVIAGVSYSIPSGKHDVIVKVGSEVLFSKTIFVSAQETKEIKIP